MRILMALSEFHRGRGYPRYGAMLALALARRGHEVTVLTRVVEREPGDEILSFRTYSTPARGTLALMAAEPLVVSRAFRSLRGEYDVVMSIGIPVTTPAVVVGLGTHRGFVRASTGPLGAASPRRWAEALRPFHRIVLAWERAMLRRGSPQVVVTGAPQFAREYPELFGFPEERVAVVPMGIDLESFTFDADLRARTRAELGIGDDTRVMLNIAGRARQKGLDTVCDALDGLDPAGWTFLFAGDGSTSPWIERRTASHRAAGRVRLLGRVPDVRALYCAADLVVFPSRYDPWGLVVTESLACGTPVVCSETMGAAVAVRPGENGLTISDPNDAAALRDAVALMLFRSEAFDRDAVRASVEWLTWDAGAERLEPHLEAAAVASEKERRR